MARPFLLLWLALGIGPGAALASGPGGAAEPAGAACAAAVAARVQAHYEQIQDLRARFSQTTQSVTLGSSSMPSLEATGEVIFAKPGRMRWSYETPERSLVVTHAETLWIYDPEAREAQRMTVTGAFLSGAAIQFLLGQGDLEREFEVSSPDCAEATGSAPGSSSQVGLELLPREPAHYEKLSLRVDPVSGRVHETTVVDLFGNRTRVELRDVEVDFHPKAGSFHFDPPEGVRVIDLSAEQPNTQ
jgi:outer membrane lipoprotein carrier protein